MTNGTDPLSILRDAREFVQQPNQTEFLVVRDGESGPDVGKLNIGLHAQDDLDEIVHSELNNQIGSIEGGATQVRELDVANTVTSESIIQFTESRNLPDTETFDLLTSAEDYESTTYTQEPTPNFQLIRITDTSGDLLIGVQNYQNASLVETTSSLALLFSDQEYERFDGEMVVVRDNLNAVYYDGYIFVMTPSSFESMFNMREEYQDHAEHAISTYRDSGIRFQDEDRVEDWLLSHINMLREMYDIQQSGLPERTDPQDIISIIDSFDLDVSYQTADGEVLLDIDEYTDSWQLLRLLGAKYAETEEMDTRWEIDEGRRL
jgi:hypothetical protein